MKCLRWLKNNPLTQWGFKLAVGPAWLFIACFAYNVKKFFHLWCTPEGSVQIWLKSNLFQLMRAKVVLAPLGIPKWAWSSMSWYRMFDLLNAFIRNFFHSIIKQWASDPETYMVNVMTRNVFSLLPEQLIDTGVETDVHKFWKCLARIRIKCCPQALEVATKWTKPLWKGASTIIYLLSCIYKHLVYNLDVLNSAELWPTMSFMLIVLYYL